MNSNLFTIKSTSQFEKDIKSLKKRSKNFEKLKIVLEILINSSPLPKKYKNHKLKGNFTGRYECHIEPDWLMIYRIQDSSIILERTGTHSDLFK